MPQSRAPWKWSRKIGGPSTRNAARQKFESAKPTIGVRTHARETTSRKPSRISTRKRLRSARVCAATFSCTRKNALRTKLAESMTNTQPVPATAIRAPDAAGPKMFAELREMFRSAFAGWRHSRVIVCGTSPSDAGPKKAEAAPKTALVTKKSGSVMWPVRSITPMNAWTTPRTRSQASITARRGRRSATTPPTSVKTTREPSPTASTPPSATVEWPTASTAKAIATGTSASPAAEATRPSQRSLNGRCRSGTNVPPIPTDAP